MREPENGSVVMFDLGGDGREFWWRDDEKASAEPVADLRWFEADTYPSFPISWRAVLHSAPDSTPILLVRAS